MTLLGVPHRVGHCYPTPIFNNFKGLHRGATFIVDQECTDINVYYCDFHFRVYQTTLERQKGV